jgi:hypothetical protein
MCLLDYSLLAGLITISYMEYGRQQKRQPQPGYELHEQGKSSRLSLLVFAG